MKNSLFSYLPDTYKKSKVMKDILAPQETQLDKARERQDEIAQDVYPSTTMRPELWENEYAIEPVEDLERRRKNIIAKMRGVGTVTLQLAKDIVQAYTDGEVTAEEDNDDCMLHFEITSATAGIADADIMRKQLYETIPAHIDFQYGFHRPLSGEVNTAAVTQTTKVRQIGG